MSLLLRPAFRNPRPLRPSHGKAWSREDLPFVKEDHVMVRGHLNSLDIQMFMGLVVAHP